LLIQFTVILHAYFAHAFMVFVARVEPKLEHIKCWDKNIFQGGKLYQRMRLSIKLAS